MTIDEILGLQTGDRIHHSLLGDGTVSWFRGSESDPRIIVEFDDCGEKELLVAFCENKIERI